MSPQQAIVHYVAEVWDLEPFVSDSLNGLREAHPRYPSTRLPSSRSRAAPLNVLSSCGTSITLEWQAHIQRYKSDVHSYVWQYHLEPPKSLSVTVFTLPTSNIEQRRIAVLFNSSELLHQRLTRLREEITDEEGQKGRKIRYLDWPDSFPWQHQWAASHELLNLILHFYTWMTEDTARFLDIIRAEIRKMVRSTCS